MKSIFKKIQKLIHKLGDKLVGNSLMQESNTAAGDRKITSGMPKLARSVAAEGYVLLKNDGVLPLSGEKTVSMFGRCQSDYFYVGYGSGGDVHPPYRINLTDAMLEAEKCGHICLNHELLSVYDEWRGKKKNKPDDGWWGNWPTNYPEMCVSEELAIKASSISDIAIIVIGRAAGEDRESLLKKGSYYLTDVEKQMIHNVTNAFRNTVIVLDCGNIIDLAWTENLKGLSALIYAWQGGMESGNALVDVLLGRVNPSGKLTDTIAKNYADYPSAACFGGTEYNYYKEDIFVGYRYFETFAKDRVLFPFGFGLSYTEFRITVAQYKKNNDLFSITVLVENIGKCSGKEVVQIYTSAPQGKLGKPSKVLVAFAKTNELQPGESVKIDLKFSFNDFASYDDSGITGHKHSYVLEAGRYTFYAGQSVRASIIAGFCDLEETLVISQHENVCGVKEPYLRYVSKSNGSMRIDGDNVPTIDYNLKQRILNNLPSEIKYTGDKGYKLYDVATDKITLDAFIAQMSEEELEALTRGYGCMNAPFGAKGNAGAYGGILPSLKEKGIAPVITADGPAGVRVSSFTSLLPSGTALASTWNKPLIKQLYTLIGGEMNLYGVDVLLAVGMNIHRNPLCGRNFEYFSEDPYLTGHIACAVTDGIQSTGKGACIKHFACNNQETKRSTNDSRVSERALREIYLKGFEICVKKSNPVNIMVSYNKINGVWAHYNYDLATVILRNEWNYDGLVITDWWMQKGRSPEFKDVKDNAYRVRAGVDVLMPGNMSKIGRNYKSDGTLLGSKNGITIGEIQRCAKNTLKTVLKLHHKQL